MIEQKVNKIGKILKDRLKVSLTNIILFILFKCYCVNKTAGTCCHIISLLRHVIKLLKCAPHDPPGPWRTLGPPLA